MRGCEREWYCPPTSGSSRCGAKATCSQDERVHSRRAIAGAEPLSQTSPQLRSSNAVGRKPLWRMATSVSPLLASPRK